MGFEPVPVDADGRADAKEREMHRAMPLPLGEHINSAARWATRPAGTAARWLVELGRVLALGIGAPELLVAEDRRAARAGYTQAPGAPSGPRRDMHGRVAAWRA